MAQRCIHFFWRDRVFVQSEILESESCFWTVFWSSQSFCIPSVRGDFVTKFLKINEIVLQEKLCLQWRIFFNFLCVEEGEFYSPLLFWNVKNSNTRPILCLISTDLSILQQPLATMSTHSQLYRSHLRRSRDYGRSSTVDQFAENHLRRPWRGDGITWICRWMQ